MAPRTSNLRIKFIPILMKRGPAFPLIDQKEFLAKTNIFLRGEAKETIKRELKSFTAGWSTTVNFSSRVTLNSSQLSILVFPKGQPGRNIWIWVSDGTKRKLRRAKKGPSLRFRSGYSPHTTRGGRKGGPGFAQGPFQFPTSVINSIEARNFETKVKDKVEERLQRKIRIIFKQAYKL